MAGNGRNGGFTRRLGLGLATTLAVLLAAAGLAAADASTKIPAAEAAQHVGETAEVCGRVASAAYISTIKGQPTFLNFERPYPDQVFTVVIWGAHRWKFDAPPERLFNGKTVCVTGLIETYRGKPEIVVGDPEQLVVVTPAGGGAELSDLERVFVKALLASLGYEANYGTGEWDERTVEATVSFQEASGLPTTGEPDPATLRALADAVRSIPESERTMVIRLVLFELARRLE